MKCRRFSATEFGIGLLSGALLGMAMGVMVAPRSGVETRERLTNRANGLKYTASDLYDQAKQSLDVATLQVEKVIGLQERSLRRKLNSIKSQLDEFHLNEV